MAGEGLRYPRDVKPLVGVIGGTGIGSRLAARGGQALAVPTPAGIFRARLLDCDTHDVAVIQRHAAGHKVPPHRVNYKAFALGLKQLGAKACLASAAVGSLREDWDTGTFAVCSDFLDLTGRRLTLFDRVVVHRDFSAPFPARHALLAAAADIGEPVRDGGVYVCGDGPRYETPQEIRTLRNLGGDVVGMTASSEAILFREAFVPYACLAVVTNLACGLATGELDHLEVVDAMEARGEVAVAILMRAAERLATS